MAIFQAQKRRLLANDRSTEMNDEDDVGGKNVLKNTGTMSVGRDVNVGDRTEIQPTKAELDDAFRNLYAAATSAENRVQAEEKIDELKAEAAKGKDADDTVLASLVEGFVGLVPVAASAIVSAFATPIIGAAVGPVTKYVLSKIAGPGA